MARSYSRSRFWHSGQVSTAVTFRNKKYLKSRCCLLKICHSVTTAEYSLCPVLRLRALQAKIRNSMCQQPCASPALSGLPCLPTARRLTCPYRAIGRVQDSMEISRTVSTNGFSADWSIPFIARGVRAEGTGDSMGLDATALGVSFIRSSRWQTPINRSTDHSNMYFSFRDCSFSFYLLLLSPRRKNWFRPWFPGCRRCHGDSAFGECGMDLPQPHARNALAHL